MLVLACCNRPSACVGSLPYRRLPTFGCRYGASSPQGWYERCVETERAIVLTAQKLKMELLVLHATGPHSHNNMQKLAKFLGKRVSADAEYPHVWTPTEHRGEKEPPADEPDPNEDLWGDWNGGVPTGSFTSSFDWVASLPHHR